MVPISVSTVTCLLLTWIDPNPSTEKGFPFSISHVALAHPTKVPQESWKLRALVLSVKQWEGYPEAAFLEKWWVGRKEINKLCRGAAHDQPCLLSKSVCWLLLWLRKASGTQWAVCSSAERASHFTYAVWHILLSFTLEEAFFKNPFREERSNGHMSMQLLEPCMPASCCRLDKLLTAVPMSWFERVECRVIMLNICYQTAEKVFVLGRQASSAILSQLLSGRWPWAPVTRKEGVSTCERRSCARLLHLSGRSEEAGVCSDGHRTVTQADAPGSTCFLLTDCWLTEHLPTCWGRGWEGGPCVSTWLPEVSSFCLF